MFKVVSTNSPTLTPTQQAAEFQKHPNNKKKPPHFTQFQWLEFLTTLTNLILESKVTYNPKTNTFTKN